MTTEEMNRVIAEWIGVDVDFDEHVYRDSRSLLRHYIDNKPKTEPLLFDKSYDWLMPVWQKLRGDIKHRISPSTVWGGLNTLIETAILDTDITTAHRLMVEAIELIKK